MASLSNGTLLNDSLIDGIPTEVNPNEVATFLGGVSLELNNHIESCDIEAKIDHDWEELFGDRGYISPQRSNTQLRCQSSLRYLGRPDDGCYITQDDCVIPVCLFNNDNCYSSSDENDYKISETPLTVLVSRVKILFTENCCVQLFAEGVVSTNDGDSGEEKEISVIGIAEVGQLNMTILDQCVLPPAPKRIPRSQRPTFSSLAKSTQTSRTRVTVPTRPRWRI